MASNVSSLVSAVIAFLLVLSTMTSAFSLNRETRAYGLMDGQCSKTTPCKWTICPWTISPISQEADFFSECETVQNDCKCPQSTQCRVSMLIDHGFYTSKIQWLCM